jgi:CDP-glycerol glycerophosphotransferase (TagB/SpsB family)
MNPSLLYIDPGTGSMLFSIFIGAAATLFFLARTFIIRLKVILSGGRAASKSKSFYPYVIYNEGKQYWNVFQPILDAFEQSETPLVYLTSSEDDPFFSKTYNHIRGEYIGEGNRAFARLNFLQAGILLMTTPGLGVYQLKRAKTVKHYSHVLHMASDPATYRLFSLDYFDSILLSGDYQGKDIRELENLRRLPAKELVTVGCTYLDMYAEKYAREAEAQTEEKTQNYTVLVSPSWGPAGLLSRYGEKLLDPLVDSGFHIIIRPHPQSKISEAPLLDALNSRYREKTNVEWNYDSENIHALSRADTMISDFSGIIFDYIFLCDKPVLYAGHDMDLRPYDASDLNHEMWQMKTLREIGIELKEEDFPRIADSIARAMENPLLREARQKAKDTAWQYRGEAGKRIADFMIAKVLDTTPKNL